jgi:hypothetical protein
VVSLVAVLLWAVVVLGGAPATACEPGTNANNTHSTNGIFHGWSRTWSCDHWVYQAVTSHGHGKKWAAIFNTNNNNILCYAYNSNDSTTCSVNSTSKDRASFNDTGALDPPCAYYNDGHGICEHIMEKVL